MHLRDRRVAGEELHDPLGVVAVPVHPHRRASCSPRSTSHASNGPATAPMAFWWKRDLLGERRGRCTTSAPPTTSEWPPQYFVVECTTTSAPRVSGCWRYGEAKVLSTTSSAPASWATAASASMSPMLSSGLVGVSTQTSLVSPGRIAARTASTSDTGAGGVREAPRLARPWRTAGRCRRTRRRGSPRGRRARTAPRSRVCSAARPLANAKPALALLERRDGALERGAGGVRACGSTRSRRAARRRRPACRCWSRRSAGSPRRWSGRARSRRGSRASRNRTSGRARAGRS